LFLKWWICEDHECGHIGYITPVEMAKKASLYYNQKNPNGKKHQKKGA
jgi:hypothetical protein